VKENERPEPPLTGDERATLIGFLDYQRATLEWKCSDLSPEQLAARSMPPSTMSLLGLVRHLAEVEYGWFDRVQTGDRRLPPKFYTAERPDDDFDAAVGEQAAVDEAFERWHEAIAESRRVLDAHDLDDTFVHRRWNDAVVSVRWVLVHMIEEYARHNGHADLLREAIDGSTGE
jgi:uncharacterized damage-inducible protein DinB